MALEYVSEEKRKWLRFPALVTRQQAARSIGVTMDELEALDARGEGPTRTDNGTTECYRREHLKAFIRQRSG